jgi:hypothetical protein
MLESPRGVSSRAGDLIAFVVVRTHGLLCDASRGASNVSSESLWREQAPFRPYNAPVRPPPLRPRCRAIMGRDDDDGGSASGSKLKEVSPRFRTRFRVC